VKEALTCEVDIIMLDNFPLDQMAVAVQHIRQRRYRNPVSTPGLAKSRA
jgi:nicotinate-nucleotide pyrophosphorylase